MNKKLLLLALMSCATHLFGAHRQKVSRHPVQKSVDLLGTQAQWTDPRTKKIMQTRTLDILLMDGVCTHATLRIIKKREINVFMPDADQSLVIGRLYKQMAANQLSAKKFWDDCTQQVNMPSREYHDEVKECDFNLTGIMR